MVHLMADRTQSTVIKLVNTSMFGFWEPRRTFPKHVSEVLTTYTYSIFKKNSFT